MHRSVCVDEAELGNTFPAKSTMNATNSNLINHITVVSRYYYIKIFAMQSDMAMITR